MERSLSRLGLLATVAVVAVTGSGCGGGSKYNNDGDPGKSGTVVTPVVIGDTPYANTAGTRGTLPLAVYPRAFVDQLPIKYFLISPSIRQRLEVPAGGVVAAPDLYADRKFDHFELNGSMVSTGTHSILLDSSILSLDSLPLSSSGTLTAVYTKYDPGKGVLFTPNYNHPDNARWDSMPIKVYLDPSLSPNEGVRQLIIAGLDKWVNASGGIISYLLVKDNGSADVSLVQAESLAALGSDTATVLAITIPEDGATTTNGYRHLKKAIMYFTPDTFNVQNGADQRQFSQIIAHEFGHALGIYSFSDSLVGHSPDPKDLMSTYVNFITGEITSGDIATIANLYRPEYDAATAAGRAQTRIRPTGPTEEVTIKCDLKKKP